MYMLLIITGQILYQSWLKNTGLLLTIKMNLALNGAHEGLVCIVFLQGLAIYATIWCCLPFILSIIYISRSNFLEDNFRISSD